MSRQRWGTFSVRDHVGPQPFATEVLMFDRLIIPYPADPEERRRWSEAGWAPDRLDEMLAVLRTGGDELKRHAITVPWNKYTNNLFDRRVQTAGILDLEANFQLTRRLLAEDLLPEPGPGVAGVSALAAYRSVGAAEEDWIATTPQEKSETLTAAFAHQFFVPTSEGKTEVELLKEAVGLADDAEFQRKRARMYKWQDDRIRIGFSGPEAIKEMAEYVDEYNSAVKKGVRDVYVKFAFTLVPVGIALASGPLAPGVGLGAIANLVRFWIYDRKPIIKPGESEAAAMIHTVQDKLGWSAAAV